MRGRVLALAAPLAVSAFQTPVPPVLHHLRPAPTGSWALPATPHEAASPHWGALGRVSARERRRGQHLVLKAEGPEGGDDGGDGDKKPEEEEELPFQVEYAGRHPASFIRF